ncbi:MAG: antitoxin family protein [Phycisphaerales bacterium]
MTRTIDAIFVDGVFRPAQPLPLRDNERVRITVETVEENGLPRAMAIDRLRTGFGKLRLDIGPDAMDREGWHARD